MMIKCGSGTLQTIAVTIALKECERIVNQQNKHEFYILNRAISRINEKWRYSSLKICKLKIEL